MQLNQTWRSFVVRLMPCLHQGLDKNLSGNKNPSAACDSPCRQAHVSLLSRVYHTVIATYGNVWSTIHPIDPDIRVAFK